MLTVALCVRSSCSVIRGSAPCLSIMAPPLLTVRPEARPRPWSLGLHPVKMGLRCGMMPQK